MPMPTILLVDDDEVDATAIKRALHQQNLPNAFIHAIDRQSALAIIRSQGLFS